MEVRPHRTALADHLLLRSPLEHRPQRIPSTQARLLLWVVSAAYTRRSADSDELRDASPEAVRDRREREPRNANATGLPARPASDWKGGRLVSKS